MLKPLPNILAITGGVSSRQKEGKEKTQLGTSQQCGTLSHDSLTTSMFGNAQTCNFLPRKQVRKNDRPRPRTFLRFHPHQEALEEASAAMLESKPFKNSKRSRACNMTPKDTHTTTSAVWDKKKVKPQRTKHNANTHTTHHTRCLRQKEGKTLQNHTKQMECCRRHGKQGRCYRQHAPREHT